VAKREEAGTAVAQVVTGEAVVLEVPCARFPSRLLAQIIDMVIQLVLLFILLLIVGLAAEGGLDTASAGAIGLTVLVFVIVGYPVIWETLTRGATPGKYALGLRVVGDDGSPERFRQALVRGLAGVVEIWLLLGCPALICSLLSDRGKRLGDLFAGTFVIQQRLPARQGAQPLPPVPPQLAFWATSLEMSGLTEQNAETARRYLARLPELTPAAQAEIGYRVASAVSAQVSPPPPPGTPIWAYLSAVLTERRNREHAKLARAPAGAPVLPPWGQPAFPAYAPPAAASPGQPGIPPAVPWGQPAAPAAAPPATPVWAQPAVPAPAPPAAAPWGQPPTPAYAPPAVPAPPTAYGVPVPPPSGPSAWSPGAGAAQQEKEQPDQQPPAGAGGFVPPA
jgi:uncharacterized RDD family membrane protein YckC